MPMMSTWLDVNTVLFTAWGYAVSPLELVGVVFNLAGVVLATHRRVGSWPIGLVGVILFGILFYQIQLYADVLEQVYYGVTGIYGWWVWAQQASSPPSPLLSTPPSSTQGFQPRHLTLRGWCGVGSIVLVGTLVMTWLLGDVHRWLPRWFPEPASFPLWDALTTVMSLVAQLLMAQRYLACWPLWMAVNAIGTVVYAAKGVVFVSGLFGVFLILSIWGFWSWAHGNDKKVEWMTSAG